MIPISTALALLYVFPAFAALFSTLFFKEKITKDLLRAAVTLVGVAVMLDSRLEGALLGQIMSLLGAAFNGIAVAALKKARKTNGPLIIYLYCYLAGAAMSFVPFVADRTHAEDMRGLRSKDIFRQTRNGLSQCRLEIERNPFLEEGLKNKLKSVKEGLREKKFTLTW